MRALLDLLRNRWVLGGLAAVALALVAWFVGDIFAIGDFRPLGSEARRGVAIAFIAAAWLAFEAVRIARARRADRALMRSISGHGDGTAQARASAEVDTLRKRFEEATATLRRARLQNRAGERQHLYQLPWYVIIGAPGSGKTTALVNSGLRFPLEDEGGGHVVKGVGGTRNCDWWFTEEAVLLDTAGRYTTQDSESEVDTAAWRGFLDLLKRFRPRQPINGALVTVSVSDLLSQDDEGRRAYARNVRQRMRELRGRLGVRFPVYLMVTKTDLLAGFMEFFGDLSRDDREQVWGATFAVDAPTSDAQGLEAGFKASFGQLEQRLFEVLLERLGEERDPQRRTLAYAFPQQFGALGPLLAQFVRRAFRADGAGASPWLRGVYFTSGTQEGSPIDRVLGRLARSFNIERKVLPPAASSGKSFFLYRMLRDIVFQEEGLAGFDEGLERRRRIGTRAAYAAGVVLGIGLLVTWSTNFASSRTQIAEARERVAAIRKTFDALPPAPGGDAGAVVKVLDALRELPGGYAARAGARGDGTPRFGQRELAEREVEAYRRALADVLIPRAAHALELAMRKDGDARALGAAVAAYEMLFDKRAIDGTAFVGTAAAALLGNEATRVAPHLEAALESKPLAPALAFNSRLVEDARRRLGAASATR